MDDMGPIKVFLLFLLLLVPTTTGEAGYKPEQKNILLTTIFYADVR